jgi:RNA polymerase sigma-70 factor (ECF subfamily)
VETVAIDDPLTSSTLLARLRDRGDESAWRGFVTLYGPIVFRLARRCGLDRESADALVQAFCVRVVEAAPRLVYDRRRGRFRDWVRRVALNEIRRLKRGDAARARAVERYRRRAVRASEDPRERVARWWEQAESKRVLRLALERLRSETAPEKFAVFYLLAMRGLPLGEVASFYGISKCYASVIRHRLLRRLKAKADEITAEWND